MTRVDLSCLNDDPLAPPTADLALTNLSAVARAGSGGDGSYYLGDKWKIDDRSHSSPSAPIDTIQWDVFVPPAGSFTADARRLARGVPYSRSLRERSRRRISPAIPPRVATP